MRCGGTRRQHVFREFLPREGRRTDWIGLRGGGALGVHRGRRHAPVPDGKERLARGALEQVDVAGLGNLCDGINRPAISRDRYECRRGGKVPVPEIVLHALEMPDALSCACVERQQRVGEEVVAVPIGTVEIE